MNRRRPLLAAALLALLLVAATSCSRPEPTASEPSTTSLVGEVLYQLTVAEFSPQGTLAAVIPHLDTLRDDGVRVLVLNPIHPAGGVLDDQGRPHPYAVTDHLAIDPALGSDADFTRLLEAAHARGMRILVDMVLNHGAVDHVEITRHPAWFVHDADGRPTRRVTAWRNVVDFDHGNPDVCRYLDLVLESWARRGCDGLRFLHANLQHGDFWQERLARLRAAFPDLYLIADSHDPRHLDQGFDAVVNPGFLGAARFAFVDDVAQHGLAASMWHAVADTARGGLGRDIFFLEDRFSRRTAELFPWPRGAGYVACLLTLPGHPLLYNGQEWGCAQPASLQGAVPLDRATGHAEWEPHYRSLLRLRASSEAVRLGQAAHIPTLRQDMLAYLRRHGAETVLVAVNLTNDAPRFALPDSLRDRRWQPWVRDRFGAPVSLPSEVQLEPCDWQAWRLVP